MLAAAMVHEVKRLLIQGTKSHRAIAEQMGISRGTVGAIALGRRLAPQPQRETAGAKPLQRCPTCGGTARMPCRLCRTRGLLVGQPQANAAKREEPPELELRPDHRARYEQVRAWRRQAATKAVSCCD